MFAWAEKQFERLSETIAPPPSTTAHRYQTAITTQNYDLAMALLSNQTAHLQPPLDVPFDPHSTVIVASKGTLPIHFAAQHAFTAVLTALIQQYQVSPEQFDQQGNTPLHYATQSKHPNGLALVKMLVTEYNVNVTVKNAEGQTPYDVSTVDSIRQYLLPIQLQRETQACLDNGGAGLPQGIDLGGMAVNYAAGGLGPPPMGGGAPPVGPPPVMNSYGGASQQGAGSRGAYVTPDYGLGAGANIAQQPAPSNAYPPYNNGSATAPVAPVQQPVASFGQGASSVMAPSSPAIAQPQPQPPQPMYFTQPTFPASNADRLSSVGTEMTAATTDSNVTSSTTSTSTDAAATTPAAITSTPVTNEATTASVTVATTAKTTPVGADSNAVHTTNSAENSTPAPNAVPSPGPSDSNASNPVATTTGFIAGNQTNPPTFTETNSAPTSTTATTTDSKSSYARRGFSSAGVLPSNSKYQPDGFHSSSSDVSLQKKYGHDGNVTGPPSGQLTSHNNLPPPPISGGATSAPTSAAPSTLSSVAAPTTTSSTYGGYARGAMRSRYPTYDAVSNTVGNPTTTATTGYPPQPQHGQQYHSNPYPNYSVFNPSNGSTDAAAATQPTQQYSASQYSQYNPQNQQMNNQYAPAPAPVAMNHQQQHQQPYQYPQSSVAAISTSTSSTPAQQETNGQTQQVAQVPSNPMLQSEQPQQQNEQNLETVNHEEQIENIPAVANPSPANTYVIQPSTESKVAEAAELFSQMSPPTTESNTAPTLSKNNDEKSESESSSSRPSTASSAANLFSSPVTTTSPDMNAPSALSSFTPQQLDTPPIATPTKTGVVGVNQDETFADSNLTSQPPLFTEETLSAPPQFSPLPTTNGVLEEHALINDDDDGEDFSLPPPPMMDVSL